MTIKEYEKALSELKTAVTSLSEENTLLRDFAYNVDPNARIIHAHMFNANDFNQHSEVKKTRSLSVNSARNYRDKRQSQNSRNGSQMHLSVDPTVSEENLNAKTALEASIADKFLM